MKKLSVSQFPWCNRLVKSESNPIFHLRNLCRFFLRMDVMIWETVKSKYVCDVKDVGGGGGGGGGGGAWY